MVRSESDDRGAWAPRGRQLGSMSAAFDRFRRNHQQNMALGSADLRLLWLFTDGAPRSLKQIAHELGLEQSTVNRQVNTAVGEGLLEKSRPSGGAAYLVVSTAVGREAFEKDVEISLEGYEAALRTMGDADASMLLQLMERFVGAYGDLAPPSEPR